MLGRTIVTLASCATLVSLVVADNALAAKGGNAANAKLCQKDGWQTLMDSAARPFPNEQACVSHGAHGGAIYALARLQVELCPDQPFDGICVSTSGSGLQPTTVVTTTLFKNDSAFKAQGLVVEADGSVSGPPTGSLFIPCEAGNVYSASASGTSADSLSTPTQPGVPISSNTVTRTSSCP